VVLVVLGLQEFKLTKHIHIINGDSSNWKVKVLVQDKKPEYNSNGEILGYVWDTIEKFDLGFPGQLATRYITNTRRLIIEEDGV
jgi:hypothetical protein